ncbi:MAG: hypothetical protein LQ340_004800 [Diploschistes diacapsis]|nr:MAG: hypothetical protein LQ340_004800 [Diploschistes diacapsis]
MHLAQALIVSALAATPSAASWLSSRSPNSVGRFTLPLQRRSTSGDELVDTIYGGTDWVTSANFGGQDLRVQIDTGSGDLWVVSTLLPQDFIKTNLSQNRIYDPSKSSSWKQIQNEMFNISYDTGELGASGQVGTETVNIGGATVTDMIVGAATTVFGLGIIDTTYDGTLGLGWRIQNTEESTSGKPKNGPTFMEAVQSQLDQPVFTADFNPAHEESLSFGFVNSSLFTGSLTKVSIDNSTTYWSVDGVTYTSGNNKLGGTNGTSILMDTGGVGTTTDPQTAQDYWTQVQGSSLNQDTYLFPCNTQTLPDLTMHFPSGGSATINGSMLNVSAQDAGNGMCAGGVQATANGYANAGFGFFSSYFTVWNQSEPSISFATYANVDDSAAESQGDLPTTVGSGGSSPTSTGSSPSGASTSSSKALAAPTVGPGLGYSVGIGALAVGMIAAL